MDADGLPRDEQAEIGRLKRRIAELEGCEARRKQIEEELRRSEEFYRKIIDDQTEFIMRWLPDGTRTFVNDAYCRYLNRSREELLGTNCLERIPPEGKRRILESVAALTPDNPVAVHAHRRICPDGAIVWQQWSSRAIYDGSGRVIEYQSVGRDITEFRRIQRALRDSEAKLHHLVEALPMGILMYELTEDDRLVLIGSNPAASRILGVNVQAMIGQTLEESFPVLGQTEISNRYRQAASRGTPWHKNNIEYEYGGIKGVYEVHAFQTSPGKMAVFFDDVTEQRQREQSLRLTRFAVDNAADAMFWIQQDGRVFDVNEAVTRLLGYSRGELLSMRVWDIDPAYHREIWEKEWDKLKKIKHTTERTRFRRKNGQWVPMEITAAFLRFQDQEYAVAFARDISERKSLEDRLRQAEKMEAIGQLAGGVAHDLNNLLTPILGYAEMLLKNRDSEELLDEGLHEIRRSGEQARNLTRQLLAFGRRQTLNIQAINLNDVVREMKNIMQRLIKENVEIEFRCREDLGPVRADQSQIEQILMNLMVNADDAISDGGKIVIETDNEELDERFADAVPGLRAGPYARLSVRDTGCGMDEATAARAFEPFFTTKDVGHGTGLGLSTVHGIAKQHKGHVCIHSSPGQGTTVDVLLPRATEAVSP